MLVIYVIGVIVSFALSCAIMIKKDKPEFMGMSVLSSLLWFVWIPFVVLTAIFSAAVKGK